jgi:hypothetical protein
MISVYRGITKLLKDSRFRTMYKIYWVIHNRSNDRQLSTRFAIQERLWECCHFLQEEFRVWRV